MTGRGNSRAWAGNHIWRLGGEHEEGWGCRHGWAWLGRCNAQQGLSETSVGLRHLQPDQIRSESLQPSWRMA